MDGFLEDVLAGCDREHIDRVRSEAVAAGALDLSRVLASREVGLTVAFEAAWTAATMLPVTRLEIRAFMSAAAKNANPVEAMQRVLITLSPLRVLLNANDISGVLERAAAAFSKSLEEAAASVAYVREAMWRRVARWYGEAASQRRCDVRSNQELFRAHGEAVQQCVSRTHPECNPDPRHCPITGFELELPMDTMDAMDSTMSVIERLQSPLIRNHYLWRQDCGGVLLLPLSSEDNNSPFRKLGIRQPLGPIPIPPALLVAALPPGLYSTVLVPSDFEAAASNNNNNIVWMQEGNDNHDSDIRRRTLWIGREPPAQQQQWLPPMDHLYGATRQAPFWAAAVSQDMAKTMLRFKGRIGVIPSANTSMHDANVAFDGSGVLNYHQLLARYAHVRALGSRVHITAPISSASPAGIGAVVAIDTRENVWTVLGVLATLDNLRCSSWTVRVYCADGNLEWMKRAILPHAPHAHIEALPELTKITEGGGRFDIEAYNALMKSEAFWDRLQDEERVLTVQDDGAIFRRGLEDDGDLLRQPYVGAPWQPHPIIAAAGVGGDSCVGNGGVSLRNVSVMRAVLQTQSKKTMFNGNAQPMPEDVFFAAGVQRLGISCPPSVARRFAFEQIFEAGAYGFHKPWAYLPTGVYLPEFHRIVEGANR